MLESNSLSSDEYTLTVIDEKNLTAADQTTILYRADTRHPDIIFQTGFQQQLAHNAKFNPTEDSSSKTPPLLMRKSIKTKEIDIASGVCATLKASRAPYFPVLKSDNSYNADTRYIYAFFMPKFFNAGAYEAANGSFAAAGFEEIVCQNVDPKYIIAAIRCEIIMRSNEKMEYKLIQSSLQWNAIASSQTIPSYLQRKQRCLEELQKLLNYDSLTLSWGRSKDKPAIVQGTVVTGDFRKNIQKAFKEYIKFWNGAYKAHLGNVMAGLEGLDELSIRETLTGTLIPLLRAEMQGNPKHESNKVIHTFIRTLNGIIEEYNRSKNSNAPILTTPISQNALSK